MRMRWHISPRERIGLGLVELTIVSAVLLLIGTAASHSLQFVYLLWNLFLAWLPLALTGLLLYLLRKHRWSSRRPFIVTVLWLLLLPNSFYMISDFIHVQDVTRGNLFYDTVMLTSFIFTGVLLGFSSLYMVHAELRKRMHARTSNALVAVILLLCSYAIYLGRDLRWNSWDVLTNPAGILFDVSDHFIHPFQGGDMYTITFSFFVLLGALYIAGWQMILAAKRA